MSINLSDNPEDARIQQWLSQPLEYRIQSTDWYKVDGFTGTLFNVLGSSDDPPVQGFDSWKEILVEGAGLASAKCYAPPDEESAGSTHDREVNFMVGGHMTLNADGSVPHGGTSYLMPLCMYHNHWTNKNPFPVNSKMVVALLGYMQGEHYATFAARLPAQGDKAYGLVYRATDGLWSHRDLSKKEADEVSQAVYPQHILIRKSENRDDSCSIEDICLP